MARLLWSAAAHSGENHEGQEKVCAEVMLSVDLMIAHSELA